MHRINSFKLVIRIALALSVSLSLCACEKKLSVSTLESVPAFEVSTLNGEKTNQNDLLGKVAIVNFWATTCTICQKELPQMIALYKEFHAQGLDYLAIAMSYDPPMYVMDFSQTRQLPFRVAMDLNGQTAKKFGDVELTPTSFLINKQGHILKKYEGEPNWNELRKLIQESL